MSQSSDLWVNSPIDTARDEGDNSSESMAQTSLITLLCDSLTVLWKDWPKDMELSVLSSSEWKFSLRGVCPHCHSKSAFLMVGQQHVETLKSSTNKARVASVMQCQGCLQFILGLAIRKFDNWAYESHYPIGMPDDTVDELVPEDIAADFAEAMRCLFVNSPKACVAMCRRAVEASCNKLGGKGKNLKAKINDLAERRKIADSLRDMAHAVRITANEQLHGKNRQSRTKKDNEPEPEGDSTTVNVVTSDLDQFGETDAKAMTVFVKEFLHHVYVMRERVRPYLEGEAPASTQDGSAQNVGSIPNSKID